MLKRVPSTSRVNYSQKVYKLIALIVKPIRSKYNEKTGSQIRSPEIFYSCVTGKQTTKGIIILIITDSGYN